MPSLLQKDARSEVHRKLLGQDKVFCKSQFSVNSVVVSGADPIRPNSCEIHSGYELVPS